MHDKQWGSLAGSRGQAEEVTFNVCVRNETSRWTSPFQAPAVFGAVTLCHALRVGLRVQPAECGPHARGDIFGSGASHDGGRVFEYSFFLPSLGRGNPGLSVVNHASTVRPNWVIDKLSSSKLMYIRKANASCVRVWILVTSRSHKVHNMVAPGTVFGLPMLDFLSRRLLLVLRLLLFKRVRPRGPPSLLRNLEQPQRGFSEKSLLSVETSSRGRSRSWLHGVQVRVSCAFALSPCIW